MTYRHTAIIAIGSNLNQPLKQCQRAIDHLAELPQSQLTKTSSYYQSEPLVLDENEKATTPWYVNLVCQLKTDLDAAALLNQLHQIEKTMGRIRQQKWEPRLIDLDLISFDNQTINTTTLTLPHPQLIHRRFVLEPLKEIAPEWRHPELGKSVTEMAHAIADKGVMRKLCP